jgi:ribosome-binding factor A
MSYRIERFASTLKHSLGDILLNELSNPEFHFISISDIVVTKDLRRAKIFVSTPQENRKDIIIKLNRAKGYIKKLLPKKMNLKYIPELDFLEDPGFELDQKFSEFKQF